MMTSDPLLGAELGDYRIVSVLGRGGMGIVYLAEDDLGRSVAIKVMAPELVRNEEFKERFIRESQAVIEHDNIVPIYEASNYDGFLYIAMKYVEGPDLKSLITEEGRLLPARTVQICTQAAAALDAAHESGVVHRDVKPQNILIERRDDPTVPEHVYLTDFGLVKRVASQSSFTDSTYLIGSVQYMSPEQIEGRRVDGRSDVYALGCVLYECLTGSVPFEKETEVAVLFSHLNEEPPSVTSKVPVLSESVDRVIAKAMAKDPNDRFLTTGEFAMALQKELGISSGRVRSVWAPGVIGTSGKRRRPAGTKSGVPPAAGRPPSLLSRALVAAAAIALFFAAWVAPKGTPTLASKDDGLGDLFAAPPLPAPDPTSGSDRRGAAVRSGASSGSPRRALDVQPGLAALDQRVAGLRVSRERPTLPAKKVSTPDIEAPTVPADVGTEWLFFTRNAYGDIYMMRPNGKGLRNLTANTSSSEATPDLSADGNKIAFHSSMYWGYDIYTTKLGSAKAYRLTPDNAYDLNPRWSPNGRWVVYEAHPNWDYNSYTDQWELGPGEIRIIRADGRKLRTLGPGIAPSWSPDGRKIVFSRADDLYLVDAAGRQTTRLTNTTEREVDPAWSPNGKQILFVAGSPGDLFVMDADGTDRRRLSQTPTQDDWNPVWSPSGDRIAWVSHDRVADRWDIWIASSDGGGSRNVTNDAVKDYGIDWGVRR